LIVAAGKAAWPMATACADSVGARALSGVVAGPQVAGTSMPDGFEWFDAGHPFPNRGSVAAAERALALARETHHGDGRVLVTLLSGGASAMLAAPVNGVSLDDKIAATRAVMHAGAPIAALNAVRKHLSRIKGGRLAAAACCSFTYALSDVHGPVEDDPSVIGSGPTVPDATTFRDAVEVIATTGASVPPSAVRYLQDGLRGAVAETIKPGALPPERTSYEVIGNRHAALEGGMRAAQARGYTVQVIAEATAGEAREAAHQFLTVARFLATNAPRPLCVIATGETTVRVVGRGRGGRNQEFALAAAPAMGTVGRAAALASAGTDGLDGPTDAAGAIVDSSTLERASRAGVDWRIALADNDSYRFFEPLSDLIMWGPTGTNVGDVHVLLIA
jgi:glycerate-2-kinase